MPLASLNDFGQVSIKGPSGQVVSLSQEQEADIIAEALIEKTREDILFPHKMKTEVLRSGISSIGTALGLALGGFFLSRLFGKTSK